MVSIIIPIYNVEKYLGECLSSLLIQTYHDFEVICIDDGSTDNSRVVCEAFANKDRRIKIACQPNSGVSVARNVGIQKSTGDYICFVDADDKVDCRFLEILLSKIRGKDLAICDYTRGTNLGNIGNVDKFYTPTKLIRDIMFEKIKHPNIFCFMYRKQIIEDNDIKFTEGCVKNEDTEFFLKYIYYCSTDIVITNYVGYYYRVNEASVTQSPISLKSLTSIEASRRIGLFFAEKGVIDDPKLEFLNGILTYTYYTAKQKNKEIYNILHTNYDVPEAMKKMLKFPSMRKKLVALTYLLLGRDNFYIFISCL